MSSRKRARVFPEETIIVSACLLGSNCCWNGGNRFSSKVKNFLKNKSYIKICPEIMAGLSIPRPRAEIRQGDGRDVLAGKAIVSDENGKNLTKYFIKGAEISFRLAKKYNVKLAILKAHSPSCGKGKIYDGSFQGKLKNGDGVTAAKLKQLGLKLITEDEI